MSCFIHSSGNDGVLSFHAANVGVVKHSADFLVPLTDGRRDAQNELRQVKGIIADERDRKPFNLMFGGASEVGERQRSRINLKPHPLRVDVHSFDRVLHHGAELTGVVPNLRSANERHIVERRINNLLEFSLRHSSEQSF